MKIKTGMTSVTFRKKSAENVIALVKEAGLDGIEWGGDIHVPAATLGLQNASVSPAGRMELRFFLTAPITGPESRNGSSLY